MQMISTEKSVASLVSLGISQIYSKGWEDNDQQLTIPGTLMRPTTGADSQRQSVSHRPLLTFVICFRKWGIFFISWVRALSDV